MPVTFDAASTASKSSGTATTVSWTHTMAAGTTGRILVVAVGANTSASSLVNSTNVTYAASTLTKLVAARNQYATSAVAMTELWYSTNPAAGANSVEITFANSTLSVASGQLAVSFTGTTGIGNSVTSTGASSTPNQAITLTTGDSWTVCSVKSLTAVANTTVSGETIRAASSAGTDIHQIGTANPGTSGANTYNWTGGVSTFWSIAALELLPSTFVPLAASFLPLVGVGV